MLVPRSATTGGSTRRMRVSSNNETMNVAQSKTMASGALSHWINRPASPGPVSRAVDSLPMNRLFAAISRSRPASCVR